MKLLLRNFGLYFTLKIELQRVYIYLCPQNYKDMSSICQKVSMHFRRVISIQLTCWDCTIKY